MSEYYGGIQGQAGPATRRGSKANGMCVYAKSWVTQIDVNYTWNEKEERTYISVTVKDLVTGDVRVLYDGPEDARTIKIMK